MGIILGNKGYVLDESFINTYLNFPQWAIIAFHSSTHKKVAIYPSKAVIDALKRFKEECDRYPELDLEFIILEPMDCRNQKLLNCRATYYQNQYKALEGYTLLNERRYTSYQSCIVPMSLPTEDGKSQPMALVALLNSSGRKLYIKPFPKVKDAIEYAESTGIEAMLEEWYSSGKKML